MKVAGKHYSTIWFAAEEVAVYVIDQSKLPHQFMVVRLDSLVAVVNAIKTMQVRGAPLIGATAAFGMVMAMAEDNSDAGLSRASDDLLASRPTAVNLSWAVHRLLKLISPLAPSLRYVAALNEAERICAEDIHLNQSIARHGLQLLQSLARKPDATLNVLTHCNAGWLATVDWGTALAPVYAAHDAGILIHVWVDETRPRNQGASLTAWELAQHGVPHTVITDNAGGHLMQHGLVDCVIVGADRVTATGDVCNKIGTYLKALAAFDNQVPFYVAVPSPTIDWTMQEGLSEIPIEARSADEVAHMTGLDESGQVRTIRVIPASSQALNPAFDVTPARLVTSIITERGVCAPDRLSALFEDRT
jgi:methylthioribose-1-phosphate isomerase